jgi:7-cyano-7-deazaguanine synthase in queuosine biosynthesis
LSGASIGDTTLYLTSLDGFADTGTIMVHSQSGASSTYMISFDYTSKTDTSVTGSTAISRALTSGDVVIDTRVKSGCPFCGSYTFDKNLRRL